MRMRRTWWGFASTLELRRSSPWKAAPVALASVALASVALASLMPATAAAAPDDPDCPPGAFCEEVSVTPPDIEVDEVADDVKVEKSQEPVTVVIPPPQPGQEGKPRVFEYHPDPNGGPGQVIIYEDGAMPPRVTVAPPDAPRRERDRRRYERHRRWGMNLRVDGVLMPRFRNDVNVDSGMAGLGMSLRYRPTPAFAIDMSADFLGGIDSNGYERQELPLGLTAMLYVNPRSVAQFYLMAGMNWSFARVYSDRPLANHLAGGNHDEYVYFGGHGGMGLEFRVAPLVGINLDGLAFVRTRTDDDGGGLYPEFIDLERGEASNTSVAGMLRAGVTFWW
jgi:hypothetical protein